MSAPVRRQTLLRVEIGKRTVWLHGLDRRQAIALFRRAGVSSFMHDGTAWCASVVHVDDILAVADHGLGWRTDVERVAR